VKRAVGIVPPVVSARFQTIEEALFGDRGS
jgi:hypothetical protein